MSSSQGIKVDQWVEESGSALNYQRKGFNQVIEQIELGHVKRLVIGYQVSPVNQVKSDTS